uniref:TlmV n=1 Tax=Streptoalloteichus hindustanus TaxID=2017 RepID=A4KUB3_STRHI|nr:TlmV [Streptoalloteichus hindustanus]
MAEERSEDRVGRLSAARRELLALWLAEEPSEVTGSTPHADPATAEEHVLARVWREVLEVERIGVDDDYFALGGDSIHAIVIVARAREAGLHLTAQDLFEQRTVRALARLAVPVEETGLPEAEAPDRADLPLGPMQQGMLYHSVGGSSAGAYVVQVTCRLVGDLDRDAFRAAWQEVVTATPALRACFRFAEGDEPRQVVVPDVVVPMDFTDWRPLSTEERTARLEEHLDADRERGFALSEAPLSRLAVFQEADDRHVCVWTHHHLILDGWSQQHVLRDVLDRYDALVRGERTTPPSRPSFAAYLDWLADQDPAADETYWRDRLAGFGAPTRVAGPGCVDGQVVAARRREATLRISEQATEKLGAFCREHGVTAGSVLTAGWGLLLAGHHSVDDVLFGVTVSGRPAELPGATEMVGLFINTLPLRLNCPADTTATRWLANTQHTMAELREHQHLPLSRVERAAGRGRSGGLFDSIVVVENFPTWVGDGSGSARLRVEEPAVLIDEGYPLVLEITPGATVLLRARYDPNRLDHARVHAALVALETYVDALGSDPTTTLAVLRTRMVERWQEHVDEGRRSSRERGEQRLRAARRRAETVTEPETTSGGDR